MPGRQGLLSDKTKSKVPKTPRQKLMWARSRQIMAKATGAKSDKEIPWPVVQKIYKNAKQAGKIPKKADVAKTRLSKTAQRYKTTNKR